MIGLDGCFLKGYYEGQLLCAVAQDGNNGLYPIAVAVVEKENFQSWYWFLMKLREDIREGTSDLGWTFITDRQKVNIIPTINFITTLWTVNL